MAAPNPVRIIPATSGNLRAGGEYVIRDEFTTDRAAGAVNGTAAEPGPGTRTVVDTESKLTIAGGALTFAGGKASPAYTDPSLIMPAIVRVAGRVMKITVAPTAANIFARFGLLNQNSIPAAPVADAVIGLVNDGTFCFRPPSGSIILGSYSAAAYQFAIVLRASGAFLFVKGGAYTYWSCLWRDQSVTTTLLYPFIANYNVTGTYDSLRVPLARWLPTPLISHGFGSAFGTSDGLGHAEGVAGGIGAGGSGVTFSNAGSTWSVSGGKAINTPATFTPITVLNSGFDTDAANWIPQAGATLASVAGGQSGNCLEITNGALNYGYAVQGFAISAGTWVRTKVYAKNGTSGAHILFPDNGTIIIFSGPNADWTLKTLNFPFRANPQYLRLGLYVTDIGQTTLFDTVSMDSMALSELISIANLACADVLSGVAITRGSSAVAGGLALNWDSPSSPANGVLIYLLGANIYVDKYVAGVWSGVSTTAYTYSAGARLVVQKSGTSYRTYYNNALVKADTIADAGILSNTYHGLFSTDPTNTFDDLCIYATGTSNEYAALDAF